MVFNSQIIRIFSHILYMSINLPPLKYSNAYIIYNMTLFHGACYNILFYFEKSTAGQSLKLKRRKDIQKNKVQGRY